MYKGHMPSLFCSLNLTQRNILIKCSDIFTIPLIFQYAKGGIILQTDIFRSSAWHNITQI